MMRNYIPNSKIILPKSRKPKASLTKIQQLSVLQKEIDSPKARYDRAFKQSALHTVSFMKSLPAKTCTSAFNRLSSYEAEYRLVRIKNIYGVCN